MVCHGITHQQNAVLNFKPLLYQDCGEELMLPQLQRWWYQQGVMHLLVHKRAIRNILCTRKKKCAQEKTISTEVDLFGAWPISGV